MRAGTMTESAVALERTTNQSATTGAPKVTWTQLGIFRFFRKTILEQKALLNKEEGTTGSLIMECRVSPMTEQMTHFKYNRQKYRIESKVENDRRKHTYNITAKLVNE